MATEQIMKHCVTCDKTTLHVHHATNHILHLLLTVLTFGVWIIIWMLMAKGNPSTARCTVCGKGKSEPTQRFKASSEGWNDPES